MAPVFDIPEYFTPKVNHDPIETAESMVFGDRLVRIKEILTVTSRRASLCLIWNRRSGVFYASTDSICEFISDLIGISDRNERMYSSKLISNLRKRLE